MCKHNSIQNVTVLRKHTINSKNHHVRNWGVISHKARNRDTLLTIGLVYNGFVLHSQKIIDRLGRCTAPRSVPPYMIKILHNINWQEMSLGRELMLCSKQYRE